jgi:2,3-bisphosphoglycerate-independent phosphoglycerate mutase
MNAYEVAEAVLQKLDTNKYDIMVINFANSDMVGHTGIMDAAIKAIEVVDECVGKILNKVKKMGGTAIITADQPTSGHPPAQQRFSSVIA